MTAVLDSKKIRLSVISDTDLFTPAFVQSDLESRRYEDIYPITKLEDNGPVEFVIDNASDKFLDLNNSFLKVKCKITKANGQNLAEADKVSVINYPVSSLFSQVDIFLGGKVISSSTNTYLYRAYIKTLLNYSKEAKNTYFGMGLFYKDRTDHFDELDPTSDKTGLNKRHEFGKLSSTMFLQGRVHSDILSQGKLPLNGLPLKVTFQRNKNNFALLCAAENPAFKVPFQEVNFCLRKVQLSPHKFQSIKQRLEKTPVLYPINRFEIKAQSVAQGLSSLNSLIMLYLAKYQTEFLWQ